MTTPERPSPRRVGLVLVRATVAVTLIVVVFYLMPLRVTVDLGTILRLVAGLVALSGIVAWQVRAIARSPCPALRAFETLAVAIPVFLLLFAATYALMSQARPEAFTEVMSRTDAMYFSVTVFATVGFGDISAVSEGARVLVTVQMLADLLLLGFVLRAVLDAVERGRARQHAGPPA